MAPERLAGKIRTDIRTPYHQQQRQHIGDPGDTSGDERIPARDQDHHPGQQQQPAPGARRQYRLAQHRIWRGCHPEDRRRLVKAQRRAVRQAQAEQQAQGADTSVDDRGMTLAFEQARPFPGGEDQHEGDQRAEAADRRKQRDGNEHRQQNERGDDAGFQHERVSAPWI